MLELIRFFVREKVQMLPLTPALYCGFCWLRSFVRRCGKLPGSQNISKRHCTRFGSCHFAGHMRKLCEVRRTRTPPMCTPLRKRLPSSGPMADQSQLKHGFAKVMFIERQIGSPPVFTVVGNLKSIHYMLVRGVSARAKTLTTQQAVAHQFYYIR